MLARKSRKNLVENGVVKCDLLKAAGYIRLSVNKSDRQSDSIENQKKIIEDYAKTNSDIQFERFYIDDKASGRDFDRPAFNEMLEDIRAGKINCVIVKDLSRFGRDLIDVGYYVQMFFPSKRVRFISITNKIDTLDGMTNIAFGKLPGDRIPLISLMDEQYAIDISKKTQYVLDNYIKDGKKVCSASSPYGYSKSENDCHVLVFDMEATAVVKEIFDMASQKTSINEIVRRLNAAGIPTPINYAIAHGLEGNYNRENVLWSSRTVKDILTNRVYVGDLEQGKDEYLVPNTHEPLVSRDIFNAAQKLIVTNTAAGSSKTNTPLEDNVLRGKAICGCCGCKMQRRKGSGNADWHFFTCISNKRLGASHCTGMYIRESNIMDAIHNEIENFVRANEAAASTNKTEKAALEANAKQLEKRINEQMKMIRGRYEDFVMGIADKDDWMDVRIGREAMQVEIENISSKIEMLNQNNEQCLLFHEALNCKEKLEQLITNHIQNIVIHENKKLDIHLTTSWPDDKL